MEFRAEMCRPVAARLLVLTDAMRSLFLADPELVYWELKALGPNHIGPYHLLIQHAAGVINEYFHHLTPALRRMDDLEVLLREARAAGDDRDESEPAITLGSLPVRAD